MWVRTKTGLGALGAESQLSLGCISGNVRVTREGFTLYSSPEQPGHVSICGVDSISTPSLEHLRSATFKAFRAKSIGGPWH